MGYHGKPDWGLQLKSTVYTLDELSELAVRLGSEVFFDRRGDVIFLDNFEQGLGKYTVDGSGDGNKQLIVADKVRSGGYSLKLIGGNNGGGDSYMLLALAYPVVSKWGIELALNTSTGIGDIDIYADVYSGTEYVQPYLQYNYDNHKLKIQDHNGFMQEIDELILQYLDEPLFHVLKLVFDMNTKKYVRLILDNMTYDLSSYLMFSDPSTEPAYMKLTIYVESKTGENAYINVDNLIITQNEP